MSAFRAEQLADQLGSAVDYLGLAIEAGSAADETNYFNYLLNVIQIAGQIFYDSQAVQGADLSGFISVLGGALATNMAFVSDFAINVSCLLYTSRCV